MVRVVFKDGQVVEYPKAMAALDGSGEILEVQATDERGVRVTVARLLVCELETWGMSPPEPVSV